MMKGGHGQINQLHDITLNHASHAPQLMPYNYMYYNYYVACLQSPSNHSFYSAQILKI